MAAVLLVAVVGIVGGCSSAGATATAATAATAAAAAGASTASSLPTQVASGAATSGTATSAPTSGGDASATGGPVAGGGNLCSLLGPGDFAAGGVSGAGAPTVNPDPAGDYCVYAGVSGATGGIEFDAFVGDPVGTYQTIANDTGMGTLTAVSTTDLPAADQAGVNLNGTGGMAAIVVRRGQLVFDMSFPANPNARTQLLALASLVLQRRSALI